LIANLETLLQKLQLPAQPESLYEPIRYTMAVGGKRIRPKLVLAGCGLCAGDPNEAIPAALAVEALHNFTLIHDDIMDNADKRRNLPTVHVKWDVATAILSGDALFNHAYELLLYYGENERYSKKQFAEISRIFLEATRIVCEGQARDMAFESASEVALEEYLLMISQKTGALLKASLQLGGIVAGGSPSQIEALGIIGLEAGIAFQIQDDLLDAVGDPEKFGKMKGGDIAEGKKTYLSIWARTHANAAQHLVLDEVLGSGSTDEALVEKVITVFDQTGAIKQAENEIRKLYLSAFSKLKQFPDSPFRDEIMALLNQLMVRQN